MGIAKKAIISTSWVTIAGIVTSGMAFIGNIILARLLTPKHFGVFALALALTEFASLLGTWGTTEAIIHAKERKEHLYATAFWIITALAIGAFVLVALLTRFVTRYPADVRIMWLFITGSRGLLALSYLYSAILERELRYERVSVIQVVAMVSSLGLSIYLASRGAGVWALGWKEFSFALVSLFGMALLSPWRFELACNLNTAHWLLSFGGRVMISRMAEIFFTRLDNFAVGTFVGTQALGYYNQAYVSSEVGHRFLGPAISRVSLATYARLQDSTDRLSKAFEIVNFFQVRLLACILLIFVILPDGFISTLYGTKWLPAAPYLRVLAIFAFLSPIFGNAKQFLIAVGEVSSLAKIRLIQLTFFAPGVIVAVRYWGALGAAYVVVGNILLGTMLAYTMLGRKICPSLVHLFRAPVLIAIVLWILSRWILPPINPEEPVEFIVQASILVVGYTMMLLVIEHTAILRAVKFVYLNFLSRGSEASYYLRGLR